VSVGSNSPSLPNATRSETAAGKVFAASGVENGGRFAPQDWVLFVGISLIWGASFLLIAIALDSFTPGLVTLGRVGLGAVTLVVLKRLTGQADRRLERVDYPTVILLSIIWVGIPFTLFPLAQQYINSAVTGLLNGAMPIFAAIVSIAFVKQIPSRKASVGIALGFIGVTLISLPSMGEGSAQARGVLMVLAATVCYGFSVNIAAPLQQKYGALTLMTPLLCLATLWVLPVGLWNFGANTFSASAVIAVGFLGAVGTGGAYWIMATLVGRVGAIRASFITYLIPVVALVLGIAFRGDTIATVAIVGAALTIGGALLASR